jgi:hypothetical protein
VAGEGAAVDLERLMFHNTAGRMQYSRLKMKMCRRRLKM